MYPTLLRKFRVKNNQTYELNVVEDCRISPKLKALLRELDQRFDSFDLKDSSNFGLNVEGNLVLIDFGMTKNLYETEWVPLAEAGKLPQIYFEKCRVCGIEKELRMYGQKIKINVVMIVESSSYTKHNIEMSGFV